MKRTICCVLDWMNDAQREKIARAASELGFEVRFFTNSQVAEAKECLADAEIYFGHSQEFLGAAKSLKWFCCSWAGVDVFCAHPELFQNPDCLLSNSSGCYDETISEHMVMVTLMLLRRMPEYAGIMQRREWQNQLPIRSLKEVRITVLGAGNIGAEYARKMLALGALPITGVNRSGRAREPFATIRKIDELSEVLPTTDVLAMALPGTSETSHVLDADALALLPEGALVINIGRGSAIDQSALIDALKSGHIAGAALDVMEKEPMPADDPLWDAPNVVLTPHVSGNMTMAYTRDRCVDLFLEDLANYAAGKPLVRFVDRSVGY